MRKAIAAGYSAVLFALGSTATADTVYVADYRNSDVVKVDSGGNKTQFSIGNTYYARSLAFNAAGTLYLAGGNYAENPLIVKFDSSGNQTYFADGPGSGLLAFDKSNNLWAAGSIYGGAAMFKFDGSGGISQTINIPFAPSGFATDGNGSFYIDANQGSGYSIDKVDTSGNVSNLTSYPTDGIIEPGGLAFDTRSDLLYCVSDYNGQIDAINPTTGAATVFATLPSSITNYDPSTGRTTALSFTGMAIDSSGNVYVDGWGGGEIYNGFIMKYTPSGVGTLVVGSTTGTPSDYEGMAFAPSSSDQSLTPEPGGFGLFLSLLLAGTGLSLCRRGLHQRFQF